MTKKSTDNHSEETNDTRLKSLHHILDAAIARGGDNSADDVISASDKAMSNVLDLTNRTTHIEKNSQAKL